MTSSSLISKNCGRVKRIYSGQTELLNSGASELLQTFCGGKLKTVENFHFTLALSSDLGIAILLRIMPQFRRQAPFLPCADVPRDVL